MDTISVKDEKDEDNFLIVDEYPSNSNNTNGNGDSNNLSPSYSKRNLSPSDDRRRDRDRDRDRERRRSRSRSRSYDRRRRSDGNRHSRSPRRNRGSSRDRYRRSDNYNSSRSSNGSGNKVENKYRWEKTVYVSNIPYDIRWTQLKDLFREKVGDIMFCEVFEKDGKSLGSAAMEFRTISDAERAVEIMHHYEMGGRKISVRLDSEGYKTKQAKEAAKDDRSDKNSTKNNNGLNLLNDSTAALALSLLNPAALLNNNSQFSQNNLLNTLLGLNSNPLGGGASSQPSLMSGANPSVQQNALLNMIASQLKVEGPVTNRIFIASLDYKVDETKIKEVFNMAGAVQSVSLFKDKDNRSRGMAVVEYNSPFEALNAVAMFNHQQLMDRQMTVRFDTKPPNDEQSNTKSSSSSSSSQSKLPDGLKSIGSGLTSLLPKPSPSFQINPLSTLTNLSSSTDMTSGLGLNLNGSGLGLLGNISSTGLSNSSSTNANGNSVSNSYMSSSSSSYSTNGLLSLPNSNSSYLRNSNGSSSSTNHISKVFVKNLPFQWDERRLKDKFGQAGIIEHVEIKMKDGKSRGCGLIRYSRPDEALKAVELFNGSKFDNRTLEVKLDQLA